MRQSLVQVKNSKHDYKTRLKYKAVTRSKNIGKRLESLKQAIQERERRDTERRERESQAWRRLDRLEERMVLAMQVYAKTTLEQRANDITISEEEGKLQVQLEHETTAAELENFESDEWKQWDCIRWKNHMRNLGGYRD
jgi:hypothetical protein